MTIARDRWQQHLKCPAPITATRRAHSTGSPDEYGGPTAALALECLAGGVRGVPGRSAHPQPARTAAAGRTGRLGRVRRRTRPPGGGGRRRHPARQGRHRFTPAGIGRGQPGLRPRGRAQGRRGGPAVGGRRDAPGRIWPPPCRWTGCGPRRPACSPTWTRSPMRFTDGRPDHHDDHDAEPIAVVGVSAIMPDAPDGQRSGTTSNPAATASATSRRTLGSRSCTTTPTRTHPTRRTRGSAAGSATSRGSRWRGSCRSRRRSARRWTTARSGRWRAPVRRCSTPAGRIGP